jgi:hypothetical protein
MHREFFANILKRKLDNGKDCDGQLFPAAKRKPPCGNTQVILANILKIKVNFWLVWSLMAENDKYSLRAGKSLPAIGLSRKAIQALKSAAALISQTRGPIFAMRLPCLRQ